MSDDICEGVTSSFLPSLTSCDNRANFYVDLFLMKPPVNYI